ncbi:EexN family lipoprotein [methanotrophic endosymbiont of Bathymodiolus puteoserpentis (Logatchev)]|jgi:hypothetical protein|uniref:EexN family lipoprotein n=1 Tax=methanotrophic endosymbiont of Bathymodiolus puteoserpentis (Logatchev) TaxID=343235 RepID=UPI0013C785D9|nr:EexN family lipoprotein [methanotrophic endosymbiont of Bathymodiolus puteoserpentis (Logatchev)]SHE23302.1 hypothetical protein BPUTEOMOX_1868 [methanotrophic endosymbiont of Bathymodiolus puteoserpentis (Logatchev)]
MKYLLLIPLILTVLNGCSQEEVEATNYIKDRATEEALLEKKAEYFTNHQDELKTQRAQCRKMPRQKAINSSECKAVSRATAYLGW